MTLLRFPQFFPSLFFDCILYVFVYGYVAIGIGRLKWSYMWFHQTNLHSNLYIGKGLQDPGRKSAFDWSSGCVLAVFVCLWPSFDLIRWNWFNSIRHHHDVLWTFLELRQRTSEDSRADERWFMTSCLQPATVPAEAASPPFESQILVSRRVQARFREDLAQPHLSVGWKKQSHLTAFTNLLIEKQPFPSSPTCRRLHLFQLPSFLWTSALVFVDF